MKGSIELIIGPMFSGKSTELLRRCNRYKIAGKTVLKINHQKDTRYGQGIIGTHDGKSGCATQVKNLQGLTKLVSEHDVIAVDEAQFFKDLSPCIQWAEDGKTVVVAGLDGTYEKKPFPHVCELVAQSERVTKLTAVCRCGREASFTKRLTNHTELELVGSEETYAPKCRTCF